MIVADTNLIAYLLIRGEWTSQAEKVFQQDPHWVAPLLWRSEFRNVLAFYTRRGSLSLDQSIRITEQAESLMNQGEFEVRSAEVLSLASLSGRSAYDCESVALAQELDTQLITSDEAVLAAFPSTAVSLEAFSA